MRDGIYPPLLYRGSRSTKVFFINTEKVPIIVAKQIIIKGVPTFKNWGETKDQNDIIVNLLYEIVLIF